MSDAWISLDILEIHLVLSLPKWGEVGQCYYHLPSMLKALEPDPQICKTNKNNKKKPLVLVGFLLQTLHLTVHFKAFCGKFLKFGSVHF